ncbi:MAG TPA: hypothetical protein VD996_04135, partial [Chitinophagaceae bacterium]|nr:hypothetical protein [Chitinophagaceae bacterium]
MFAAIHQLSFYACMPVQAKEILQQNQHIHALCACRSAIKLNASVIKVWREMRSEEDFPCNDVAG